MTDAKFILFAVSAFVALGGALGTVIARRPLRAAMSLLIHIVALAGLYLTLNAHLLAAIQLLVYAGAVVVLFVFVIMLIGPAAEVPRTSRGFVVRMLSLVGMGMFTVTLAFGIVDVSSEWVVAPPGYGTVEGVGVALYRDALVPFEVVSITLLVAIIGAVAVARRATKRELAEKKQAREASDTAGQAA
ncbi:MAG: NADH-quinone oxidoreductase subunit J [Myxococcota bacterium]